MIKKILFPKLKLNTPTHFTYINDCFFIVDCWNNRILYKQNTMFTRWKKIKDLNKPHRIRFHNKLYYVCDTDNNRIITFDKKMKNQKVLETISLARPHDIQIHNGVLYIVDCFQGSSRIIKHSLLSSDSKVIFEANGVYARSFKIINNDLLLSCSSSGEIIKIKLIQDYPFQKYCENTDGFNLPCMTAIEQLNYGYNRFIPNDIEYFNGYFYMTNYFYGDSVNKFIIFKTLDDLEKGIFDDFSYLVKGVPYYLEVINEQLFMGEIDGYSCVKILIEENEDLRIKKVVE